MSVHFTTRSKQHQNASKTTNGYQNKPGASKRRAPNPPRFPCQTKAPRCRCSCSSHGSHPWRTWALNPPKGEFRSSKRKSAKMGISKHFCTNMMDFLGKDLLDLFFFWSFWNKNPMKVDFAFSCSNMKNIRRVIFPTTQLLWWDSSQEGSYNHPRPGVFIDFELRMMWLGIWCASQPNSWIKSCTR